MSKKKKSGQPKGRQEERKEEPAKDESAEGGKTESAESGKTEGVEAEPRTLLPVVPANRLKDGPSRPWVGPYGRWTDTCFESVIDRLRMAANVRAVTFPIASSVSEDVEFRHDAGEEPIAVAISALSIPGGIAEDIKIEPKVKDGAIVKMTVLPPNRGIGVGITVFFQSAGIGANA